MALRDSASRCFTVATIDHVAPIDTRNPIPQNNRRVLPILWLRKSIAKKMTEDWLRIRPRKGLKKILGISKKSVSSMFLPASVDIEFSSPLRNRSDEKTVFQMCPLKPL